jgi:polyhydroxyalkanoate synthesis regulator phasin
MLRSHPVVQKMFELGEVQIGKLAQQLVSNERFTNAMQSLFASSLKAKGLLDKNVQLALSAMNLPSLADLENLRRKLDELEETIHRLEQSVANLAEGAQKK